MSEKIKLQIRNFRGEKGEKGDKGDAFTYVDFTPEQLEGLTRGIAQEAAGKAEQAAMESVRQATDAAAQAAVSASGAESAKTAAEKAQTAAESSAGGAAGEAQKAQTSAAQAASSAAYAGEAGIAAGEAQKAAESAKSAAAVSASLAQESAAQAAGSAESADSAKTAASQSEQRTAASEANVAQAEERINTAVSGAVEAVAAQETKSVQAVAAQGEASVAAVTAEGERVLGTIPQDYTAAVGEIDMLKKSKAEIDDTAIDGDTWSSKHIVDMLCPKVEKSGTLVQLDGMLGGYPLGVTASWTPTQEGSGDPSPENIRPIKGRTEIKVERCGENLLNITPFNTTLKNGITFDYVPEGGIHIQGTASANADSPTFPIWHLPPGKYYGLNTGDGIAASIVVQRNGQNKWLNFKGNFEILPGDITIYCYIIVTNGASFDITIYPYIVSGTTAPTTYTPYIGSTNTLTLPSTVYGGEVDAVRGEGQREWRCITLTGQEPCHIYTTLFYIDFYQTDSFDPEPAIDFKNGKCSHYPYQLYGENGFIGITLDGGAVVYSPGTKYPNTNDGLREWMDYLAAQYAAGTPVQICYKQANPVPFTAAGGAAIPALPGINTVLTDADSVTVTGRADPIQTIAKLNDRIAALEAAATNITE